ncbi:hypothetical protein A5790_07240 [Mycobacterium sp. 852002-51152_SCH6134967]|uniref:hypothetical protein n=1 Tax=Mycobacterium sp. 852002-51152_SCH6134967 TaxID=1834096 RepID=UPI0007FEC774|nr:hypothetical protein [Mycobacterium sp. 852002-51152_SCH6134967]OBF95496.1 hypothetical protein A5790_07240 [Mycobacterium sp. 852002-51152_SCH6134967]
MVVAVRAVRDRPLFVKVLRTQPEAFVRSLTTDGPSMIEVMRPLRKRMAERARRWLSDEDAELVAEGITRLGVSLVLSPQGPIPLYDDDGLRAYLAL